MPRRRRLHVPGGFYYLVARSNVGQIICMGAADYAKLQSDLRVAGGATSAHVHGLCVLPQALHMIVEVSEAPLGQFVQRFASRYARAAFRSRSLSGHLFAQHPHALLFDADAYLLPIVCHVHWLPVWEHLCSSADDYAMSSHRAYLGLERKRWLTTARALSALAGRSSEIGRAYRKYMDACADGRTRALFSSGMGADRRVLGGARFLASLPGERRRVGHAKSLAEVIVDTARRLNLPSEDLSSPSRRHDLTLARAVVSWHCTQREGIALAEVARVLRRDPSTLLAAVKRYRKERPELFRPGALAGWGTVR